MPRNLQITSGADKAFYFLSRASRSTPLLPLVLPVSLDCHYINNNLLLAFKGQR